MFIDIHYRILGRFRLTEILQTNTIHQLHIPQVKSAYRVPVSAAAKAGDQFLVSRLDSLTDCIHKETEYTSKGSNWVNTRLEQGFNSN